MDIRDVVKSRYLPYAKGVTFSRAFPEIDGLKFVQRRILYDMYELMGDKAGDTPRKKSARIVGDTMGKYHPHGDSSIYEGLVNMSSGYGGYNAPYIDSKGNFGDVSSSDVECASMRYTEARLAEIARYTMFDGIKENAVDFVPNFDGEEMEPLLLPVRFPTLLVNGVSGIGVGKATNLASYNLIQVCKATVKRIQGNYSLTDNYEMMKDLGCLEFSTGGYVHASDADLLKIVNTGKGTVVLTGRYETYPNKIIITDIPFNTTVENIIEEITELAGTVFSPVTSAVNMRGFNRHGIEIKLKKGYDADEVAKDLYRYTSFRTTFSVNSEVIINNTCRVRSIPEIIDAWIDFRINTIKRIIMYRHDKKETKEHLMKSWESIYGSLEEFVTIVRTNTKANAREKIGARFNLDAQQVNYLLEFSISALTTDSANDRINDLKTLREEIADLKANVADDERIKKQIVLELFDIASKFGKKKKTLQAEPLNMNENEDEDFVDDSGVTILFTEKGYIKRVIEERDRDLVRLEDGDKIVLEQVIPNNEHMLVFTRNGEIHKLCATSIDASKGNFRYKVSDLLHLEPGNDVIRVDYAGEYNKNIVIIYGNGAGYVLSYKRAGGRRSKYINCYEPLEDGNYWITEEQKFFVLSNKRKGAYVDASNMIYGDYTRVAIRTIRVNDKSGKVLGIHPIKNVPDLSKIDLNRYSKGYFVSVKDDQLF